MRKIKFFGLSVGLEWLLLGLIVVTGALLRIEASNHLTSISPDGITYVYHASGILQGSDVFERRGPLFQCLLILTYMIFGVSFKSSILIPQFFGTVSVVLIFLLGRRLFDSKTGLVAALIATLNPMLTNLSAWVLRETLSVALVLLLILVIHFSVKTSSSKKSLLAAFLSGVVSGMIILNREEMIIVIPAACIGYLFFMEKKRWALVKKSSIFLMATLLVMSPWLAYCHAHFGNPFYSYTIYVGWVGSDISEGEMTGTSETPSFLAIPTAFFFGLWRLLIESPALFSLLALAFLPIGVMFTFKRRDLWIFYFILILDLVIVSVLASSADYFERQIMGYNWSDPTRFLFSTAVPFNVIIAGGIQKLFPSHEELKPKARSPNSKVPWRRVSRSGKIWQHKVSQIFSLKTFAVLGVLLLAIASYVPAYFFTFEHFDQTSKRPFVEAAEYLDSIGSKAGVFTMHPDLLSKYYDGAIFKLPERGGFDLILEEAQRKGVKYVLVESTSVTSLELIHLYYKSIYPSSTWTKIPSEFVLVQAQRSVYGIFTIQTEVWFKAAILGTAIWESIAPWESSLALMGGATTSFDDTTSLLSLDLSEFDVVVFSDFRRVLDDTERQHLETAIEEGLTVIVSGLSPVYLAGGTTNLTQISSWFGATGFSEAPKQERWKVKFTEDATDIVSELDLGREYAFYTDSDWSTPTGVQVEPESVVYAYRVDDQLATIIAHNFEEGTSIFVGPRYGFYSSDATIFRTFLQSLIGTYISTQ
jgi:hypothetical protein